MQKSEYTLNLDNDYISVTYCQNSGMITATHKMTGRIFLRNTYFEGTVSDSSLISMADSAFGNGTAIKLEHSDKSISLIMLYPNMNFVLFKSCIHNNTESVISYDMIHMLHGDLDLGILPSALKVLGTQGLTDVDGQSGSYTYIADVDPATNNGVVCGWMTCDLGNGVLFTDINDRYTSLDASIDFGNFRINPGCSRELETLGIGYFDDARIGLESFADCLALKYDVHLNPQPAGYCTWYSDQYGGPCDEVHLQQLADFCTQLVPYGFDFLQIDDGWQDGTDMADGPRKDFSKARQDGPYARGMKHTAGQIKSNGLAAGIWLLPFGRDLLNGDVTEDMLVHKKSDGSVFWPLWGGACTDMTVPSMQAQIHTIIDRIVNEWGYKYLKLDGIYNGFCTNNMYPMADNAYTPDDWAEDAVFSDPDITNIQHFRMAMKLIRQAAGKDTFLNACNAGNSYRIYSAAVGLFDSVRICEDGGMSVGAWHATNKYFFNGRTFYNDPDIVFVRSSINEARLSASFAGVTGQMMINSDWLPGLDRERLDILKKNIPSHGLKPRPVDLFDTNVPKVWLLTDERSNVRRDVIGMFNFDTTPTGIDYAMQKIGLSNHTDYIGFDFWKNKLIPEFSNRLTVEIPAMSTVVLAVRPASKVPQIISTSRHVSQGMIDIISELWDASCNTLSCISSIVANDSYEVRIVTGTQGSYWSPVNITLSAEDMDAGVTVCYTVEENLTRVKFNSPICRDIHWTAFFSPVLS